MNQKIKIENYLWLYRKKMLLDQKEAAYLLGRDQSLVCGWEKGRKVPTLENLFLLSILYRTPIEFLFRPAFIFLREEFRVREEKWRESVNYYEREPLMSTDFHG